MKALPSPSEPSLSLPLLSGFFDFPWSSLSWRLPSLLFAFPKSWKWLRLLVLLPVGLLSSVRIAVFSALERVGGLRVLRYMVASAEAQGLEEDLSGVEASVAERGEVGNFFCSEE